MKTTIVRLLAIAAVLCLPLTCAGCSSSTQQSLVESSDKTSPATAVSVAKRALTPTQSVSSPIGQASDFVIESPSHGVFEPLVKQGDQIAAGQVIARVAGKDVTSPVQAIVQSVSSPYNLPQYYPLFTLAYRGFAIRMDASALKASIGNDAALSGKFQVQGGVGPTSCLAVVSSSAGGDTTASVQSDTSQQPATDSTAQSTQAMNATHFDTTRASNSEVECLIDSNIPVRPGQSATLVITAPIRNDVLVLPVSAVAGRVNKGLVNTINHGKLTQVEVSLGANDGAFVEITQGLQEGTQVSSLAPNLDSRKQ